MNDSVTWIRVAVFVWLCVSVAARGDNASPVDTRSDSTPRHEIYSSPAALLATINCTNEHSFRYGEPGRCQYRTILQPDDMFTWSMEEACDLFGYGTTNKELTECYTERMSQFFPVNVTDHIKWDCSDKSCFAPNCFEINSLGVAAVQFDPAKDYFYVEFLADVTYQDKRLHGMTIPYFEKAWRPELGVEVVAVPPGKSQLDSDALTNRCDMGWDNVDTSLGATVPMTFINEDGSEIISSSWKESFLYYPARGDVDSGQSHLYLGRRFSTRISKSSRKCISHARKFPYDSYSFCVAVALEYDSMESTYYPYGITKNELVKEVYMDGLVPWENKYDGGISYIPKLLARSLERLTLNGFLHTIEVYWIYKGQASLKTPEDGSGRLGICFHLERESVTYVNRYGLLVSLVTMLSMATAWFQPSQVSVKLATCTVSLLTLSSTFQAVLSIRPAFETQTLMDSLILISMVIVIIVSGLSVFEYVVYTLWPKRAAQPVTWATSRTVRSFGTPLYFLAVHITVTAYIGTTAVNISVLVLLILTLLGAAVVAYLPTWKVFKKMKRRGLRVLYNKGYSIPSWILSEGDLPIPGLESTREYEGLKMRGAQPSQHPFAVPTFSAMESSNRALEETTKSENDSTAAVMAGASIMATAHGIGVPGNVRGMPYLRDGFQLCDTPVKRLSRLVEHDDGGEDADDGGNEASGDMDISSM